MKQEVKERYQKYLSLTRCALDKVKVISDEDFAEDLLDLAQRYFSDAQYFYKQGDVLTALLSVSYAHAFLDAGARIGVFDVDNDSNLFMVDGE